ncbi:kinase-like domain-containing protein [Chytriomyces cf. hyalinus JEL632]|nr:kinase-like domain-containing protein [Chytriomyces cf. hyalinus JEL632]
MNSKSNTETQIQTILAKKENISFLINEKFSQIKEAMQADAELDQQLKELIAKARKEIKRSMTAILTILFRQPVSICEQKEISPMITIDAMDTSTTLSCAAIKDDIFEQSQKGMDVVHAIRFISVISTPFTAFTNMSILRFIATGTQNAFMGKAQPVPPPFWLDPLNQSMDAFPSQDPPCQSMKDTSTGSGILSNVGAFFKALVKKPWSSNATGVTAHPADISTGGETFEDNDPQEPQPDPEEFFMAISSSETNLFENNNPTEYKLGKMIGEGAFGLVMTATRLSDGLQVVVKFIDNDKISRWHPDAKNPTGDLVPSEIAILQHLQHPNIIKYVDHMVERDNYSLLVTELHGSEWQRSPCSSGPGSDSMEIAGLQGNRWICLSVSQCVYSLKPHHSYTLLTNVNSTDRHLPENIARTIFAQIAFAVQYLQGNGIVHGDIKDENVVVDSSFRIKLIDFGSAASYPKNQHEAFTPFVGTALALGVLLYSMIFGERPFRNDAEIIEGTLRMPKGFHMESDKHSDNGYRDLLRRMLDNSPESRITVDENEVGFYQSEYGPFNSTA